MICVHRYAEVEGFRDKDQNDRSLVEWLADACMGCKSPHNGERLMICSNSEKRKASERCEQMYHYDCLDPPLPGVPEGDWFCPDCVRKGKDKPAAKKRRRKMS